ncbi:hypothetical protein HDU97_006299 [Phlyctochytrium planicorne]|nr:hypothetical protein HDU97_006299 [Phlyctochytrium planicorne]
MVRPSSAHLSDRQSCVSRAALSPSVEAIFALDSHDSNQSLTSLFPSPVLIQSQPLPPGWSTAWDPERRRHYYISPTGESTWYDPTLYPQYPSPPHSQNRLQPLQNPFSDQYRSSPSPVPPYPYQYSANDYQGRLSAPSPAFSDNPYHVQQRRSSVLVGYHHYSPLDVNDSEFAPLITPGERRPSEATLVSIKDDEREKGKKKSGKGSATSRQKKKEGSTEVFDPTGPGSLASYGGLEKDAKKSKDASSSSTSKRRYCCGIFRSRSGCRRFWFWFILLFFGGLGAAGFFLWPRYPTVVISNPTFPTDVQAFSLFGKLSTASPENPFVLQINMQVFVSVYSPNNWDIQMSRLNLEGNLLDKSSIPITNAVASGTAANIVISKMENTTFPLPISLAYTITQPSSFDTLLTSDPAVAALAISCGLGDQKRSSSLNLAYTARVYITLISWLGLVPQQSGSVSFPCPPIPSNFTEMLRNL